MENVNTLFKKFTKKIKYLDLIVIILVVVFCSMTYVKMAEWHVSGGMDAGNYNILAYDWVNDRDFYEDVEYFDDNYVCLSGYRCVDDNGEPLYLHVYPLVLAVGVIGAEGIGPAVMQTIIAGLALLAFYLLIRLIFNIRTAFLAFLLLALIPLQIIYSKEFMSEILSQLLLFIAVVTFYLWNKKEKYFFHLIEVSSYSLLLLTKLDAILILIPIGVIYTWLSYKKKVNYKEILPFFLFLFVAGYYYFFAGDYTNKSYWEGLEIPISTIGIALFPFILLLTNLILTHLPQRVGEFLDKIVTTRNIKIVLSLCSIFLILLIFYRTTPYISFLWGDSAQLVDQTNYNRVNIIRLTYFIPLSLILVSLFGYFRFIWKEKVTYSIFLSTLLLAFGISLLSSQHSSSIYWWGRRYLLYGVPLIAFLSAYSMNYLFKKGSYFKILLIVLIPLIFVPLIFRSIPAMEYKQNSGVNNQVYQFASSIPDDTVVLMPSGWQQFLVGSSVASIYDKEIRIYKDIGQIDFDSIEGKTFYITDKTIVKDPTACTEHPIDYSYYYVLTPICNDEGLFCRWDEAVERYYNTFTISLCEVREEDLVIGEEL